MIIVTGTQGFIGRHFLNELQDQGKEVIEVDQQGAWYFKSNFDKWDEVELILHQGAISDTTFSDLKVLFSWNIDYGEWLLKQALEHQIPIKYASSASVYGNTTDTINPLNYYALGKVTLDYFVRDHIDEFKFETMLSTILDGSFNCLILFIVSDEIFLFTAVSFSNLLTAVKAKGNKSSSLFITSFKCS